MDGALVAHVLSDSPASQCFRKFDVIVEVNGKPVKSVSDADILLDACRPGVPASVKVVRGERSDSHTELKPVPKDLLMVLQEKQSKRQSALESMIPQQIPKLSR